MGNSRAEGKIFVEFLAYSDDEDDEDGKTAQPAVSVEIELHLYLDQKCATNDILAFWQANKALFSRLYALTTKDLNLTHQQKCTSM